MGALAMCPWIFAGTGSLIAKTGRDSSRGTSIRVSLSETSSVRG